MWSRNQVIFGARLPGQMSPFYVKNLRKCEIKKKKIPTLRNFFC